VIPTWLSYKGIVPISDPDCTRFWMTAEDAVELILKTLEGFQALDVGSVSRDD